MSGAAPLTNEIHNELRDRPTDEVEITPVMIAAGAAVIWERTDLDVGPSGAESIAKRIIEAALKARRESNLPKPEGPPQPPPSLFGNR